MGDSKAGVASRNAGSRDNCRGNREANGPTTVHPNTDHGDDHGDGDEHEDEDVDEDEVRVKDRDYDDDVGVEDGG